MRTELSIDVSGMEVIPKQKLEDRIGYVARIESVSPKDEKDHEFSGEVQVGIQNKTGTLNGHSGITLSSEDFQRFLKGYDVSRPEYLVGKPVVSIYTRDRGVMLCGFVPLNLDR
jgi:hypothetical protein